MKAIDRPFTKIINGTSQFVIPVFQRDYSWSDANCKQLWQDVLRVASDSSDRGHFLGSVVYVSTGDTAAGFTRWLLIDGQQRLTTLTLLLTALRDHIAETGWTGSDDGPTVKRVDAYFLKNVQEEGNRQYKLVLRRHDNATLCALLDGEEVPEIGSERILENYEFFRECLKEADPEEVYRGIGRLIVVDVTLDRGVDDPQLIFESLNSTGVDLSQSDLIRNYILMRLPEKEQTRLYETYWSKIEVLYRGSDKAFDAFARDYIALERRASKQERADQIYFAFRRVFDDAVSLLETMESFLERLLRFARYHAAFSVGAAAPTELRGPLAQLRRLVELPATLIMRLFECHETHGTLSTAEFVEAVELIESYVFRRVICGMQTRGYWLEFARLAYRIDNERPLESLKVGLARLTESYAFPGDAEFRNALEAADVYHKRVCHHLLDRLENHRSREPTDTSQYSIEHIMPQNEKLLSEWRQMLGENWQEVQKVWLHRLGNLTLTGYNSAYSDRPFEEKKTIEGGFSDSSVRLNRFVREQEKWTEEEIRRRGEALARKALEVWPPLEVEAALVDEAKRAEMRERAARRDVEKVPMTEAARGLFAMLRKRVTGIDADVIEMAEQRSVSYHGPAFFLEVVPRKAALSLLLALDFNEIEDASGLAQDTSQWRFIVNATYDAGVIVVAQSAEEIEKALPMIHKAHELART